MSQTPVRPLDVVALADLQDLAAHRGPCASIFLPTARKGPETRQGPTRLANLLKEAAPRLAEEGVAKPEALLAPVARTLVDDVDFWQHQGDGLAVLVAEGIQRHFRLPATVGEHVTVNTRFRLRPLLPSAVGHEMFFLVALAKNSVRVFEASRLTIDELPTGAMVTSMEEALAHEDHERQLQHRSAGGASQQFHGHGAGDEVEKAALERYFRVVDAGLVELLGPTRRPVVLACVDYFLPIYQSVTALPNVASTVVAGNPEHRSALDLHQAAVAVMEPVWADERAQVVERFGALFGTGRALTEIDAIATAAAEGRVDTLLCTPEAFDPEAYGGDHDQRLDHAVADVLATHGTITAVDGAVAPGSRVTAVLRY